MAAATAFVLATGVGLSRTKYTTQEMMDAFHAQRAAVGDDAYDRDFADRVFRACGYDEHAVALPKERLFKYMPRSEYLAHRRTTMCAMAEAACSSAIARWGGNVSTVTHLYWGTMTGAMDSPTLDIALATRLGLSQDVRRTNIEGMGCLTGFRLLNLAREAALADPDARILVVAADLRSAIGNLLPPRATRADIVSCALFRDGASAAVVGGNPRGVEVARYEMMAGLSRLLPDSRDNVFYNEMDGGCVRLHLSRDLPATVAKHEPAFVATMLLAAAKRAGPDTTVPPVTDMDVACHTGGPRVLKLVGEALGVPRTAMASSWAVMQANGNLSGASNLAVLDHQEKRADGAAWVVGLSMGPGMCLEGLIFRRAIDVSGSGPASRVVSTAEPC